MNRYLIRIEDGTIIGVGEGEDHEEAVLAVLNVDARWRGAVGEAVGDMHVTAELLE